MKKRGGEQWRIKQVWGKIVKYQGGSAKEAGKRSGDGEDVGRKTLDDRRED